MDQPVLSILLLAAFSALAWRPGNELIGFVWEYMATHRPEEEAVLPGSEVYGWSPFVREVGGIERVLYIAAVMSRHYELIAGWLVLKAFFGFLDAAHLRRRLRALIKRSGQSDGDEDPPSGDEKKKMSPDEIIMARYNGLLIGNALSLLTGLAAGATAIFIFRVLSPTDSIDHQAIAWLTSTMTHHTTGVLIGLLLVSLLSVFLPIKKMLRSAATIVSPDRGVH